MGRGLRVPVVWCWGFRAGLGQRFHEEVAEFDAVAFGFDAEEAGGLVAGVEGAGGGAVDPEGECLVLGGDFEGIPFTGGFDVVELGVFFEVEELVIAVGVGGDAEEESVLGIAELGLVPDGSAG